MNKIVIDEILTQPCSFDPAHHGYFYHKPREVIIPKDKTFIINLRNDYSEQISKLLKHKMHLDIIDHVFLGYLVDQCNCCHTVICLKNCTTNINVDLIYQIESVDHDGYCSDKEGAEIIPYSHTIQSSKKIMEYETYLLCPELYRDNFLSIYNRKFKGCTSGKSQYCQDTYIECKLLEMLLRE